MPISTLSRREKRVSWYWNSISPPFDHADADGPELSRPTLLKEGNEIGLCWAVIDWDAHPASKDGFWNLSDEHTMYGNASYLRKFKLMPIQ